VLSEHDNKRHATSDSLYVNIASNSEVSNIIQTNGSRNVYTWVTDWLTDLVTNSLTYSLQGADLPEQLTVTLLAKKFPAFYGT
jgi:hypothetical protein